MKSKFLPHTKKNLEESYRIGTDTNTISFNFDHPITVTLPNAQDIPTGMTYIVKNEGEFPLTITSLDGIGMDVDTGDYTLYGDGNPIFSGVHPKPKGIKRVKAFFRRVWWRVFGYKLSKECFESVIIYGNKECKLPDPDSVFNVKYNQTKDVIGRN